MQAYREGINCEMYSPNETRDWEDLNPYEGGDVYKTRTSAVKDSGTPVEPSSGGKE
jgi:hypothetical protein